MKLAKSRPEEIKHIKDLLKECSWLSKELCYCELEDVDFSEFELLKDYDKSDTRSFLYSLLNEIKALYFEKALWNLQTLISNCADPELDYLEFNKEIIAGQDAIQLLRDMDVCLTNTGKLEAHKSFHERIKKLIEKVSVEAETPNVS